MSEEKTRGALVKRRRNELELSQSHLANLVGVSRGTIRNIEADLVEPNKSTWTSLEQILGWGPGSGPLIEIGGGPLELLPAPVLKALLRQTLGGGGGVFGEPWDALSVDQIKAVTAAADHQGRLGAKAFNELTDMIMGLPNSEEENEELCQMLSPWLAEEPSFDAPPPASFDGRRRPPTAPPTPGDLVTHETFGLGRVVKVEGSGDKTKGRVDFGSDIGEKNFLFKYAPIQNLTKGTAMSQSSGQGKPSTPTPPRSEEASLPGDVSEALATGPVIDYEVFRPEGADGVAVVAMLVKTTDSRLTKEDRRYIADVWGKLEENLSAAPEASSWKNDPNPPPLRPRSPQEHNS